jgi:hypothetical protein
MLVSRQDPACAERLFFRTLRSCQQPSRVGLDPHSRTPASEMAGRYCCLWATVRPGKASPPASGGTEQQRRRTSRIIVRCSDLKM